MEDRGTTVEEIKGKIREFVRKRDWEKFHSPKNLSMSLVIETAELMESFQWLTNEQSEAPNLCAADKKKIREEIADITINLLNMCNVLDIDLSKAVGEKLLNNARKYPIDLAKGKAHKWTHYKGERHGR